MRETRVGIRDWNLVSSRLDFKSRLVFISREFRLDSRLEFWVSILVSSLEFWVSILYTWLFSRILSYSDDANFNSIGFIFSIKAWE